MKEDEEDIVTRIHREAWEQFRQQPPPPPKDPPTIHYTELPAAEPGSALAEEWEFYRREVGRLLAEGNEGRYIVIKGQQIIGIWDRREDAQATAYQQFLLQPFLLQQIQERERIQRIGFNRLYRRVALKIFSTSPVDSLSCAPDEEHPQKPATP